MRADLMAVEFGAVSFRVRDGTATSVENDGGIERERVPKASSPFLAVSFLTVKKESTGRCGESGVTAPLENRASWVAFAHE